MSAKTLNLCFFWHMHQPDYRDESGVMRLPWVFLHAVKDYYDMPWMVSRYPSIRATFNLTASLIEQLELYAEPIKYDHFLALWIKNPDELSQHERESILKICTSLQYETMVKPLERFAELYTKTEYDDHELVDLEVVFMLSWCGNYLRRNNPRVIDLINKSRGYDLNDKVQLLETLREFVQTILPSYALWQKEGRIAVSTTPYFHPILPLLLDPQNLKRSNPDATLPQGAFALEQDAAEHIERSIAMYERLFGRSPSGFWPAEGAVDEKSLELYRRYAIKWIATDEAILYRSLQREEGEFKYRTYRYNDVGIMFRDHALSDLIGFDYRHRKGSDAAEDMISRIEHIAQNEGNESVCIIVDGENAWEYYAQNGWEFFTFLYEGLSAHTTIRTKTMDELFEMSRPKKLEHLFPGSWIYGNFDTWGNNAEKNRAWERIYQCRRDIEPMMPLLDEERLNRVRYHLLASECSDWFWWYGDDHSTDFAEEFDLLFRNHLINGYRLCGMNVPSVMFEPVLERKTSGYIVPPRAKISPVIGSEEGCYFGWQGCGTIDEQKGFSTMERKRGPIKRIRYGFDDEELFFSMEGGDDSLDTKALKIRMRRLESSAEIILVPEVGCGRIEWKIPKGGGTHTILSWSLEEGEKVLQSFPQNGPLTIEFSLINDRSWFI